MDNLILKKKDVLTSLQVILQRDRVTANLC